MLKRIWRSRTLQVALGRMLAGYLQLVLRTARVLPGPDGWSAPDASAPFILTFWHGQHFMIPFARRPRDRINVLISRHGDGEMNAVATARFGIGLVRGSGAQRPHQVRKRGGASALRSMLDILKRGESVAMTADVPKVARVAGAGIAMLARHSGRPILPLAVVMRPSLDFRSWDRASIGLPFGRCAIVFGAPLYVPRDADADGIEIARMSVERELDRVHELAFAAVGRRDPGAGRAEVMAARRSAAGASRKKSSRAVWPGEASSLPADLRGRH